MSKEIIDAIRTGVTMQVQEAIAIDDIPQLEVHAITQSYLLLQILDRLDMLCKKQDSSNPVHAIEQQLRQKAMLVPDWKEMEEKL